MIIFCPCCLLGLLDYWNRITHIVEYSMYIICIGCAEIQASTICDYIIYTYTLFPLLYKNHYGYVHQKCSKEPKTVTGFKYWY